MLSYLTVPITKFLRLFYSHKLLSVVDVTGHCLVTYFNDLVDCAVLLWFAFCTVVVVAVIDVVAVMDLAVIDLHVAVMDFFWGRYCLWPSLLWPSWFVAVIVVSNNRKHGFSRHSTTPRL